MNRIFFRTAESSCLPKQSAGDEVSDECANFSPKSFASGDTDDCFMKGIKRLWRSLLAHLMWFYHFLPIFRSKNN